MKKLLKYFVSFALGAFGERRYVRLSINRTGKIFFFDKLRKKIFSLWSESEIDSVTLDQIFTQEEYSIQKIKHSSQIKNEIKKILKSGHRPLIIDCGANVGASTYYLASCFPEAVVAAVEPNKRNMDLCRKNCSKLKNVIFYENAIGCQEGFGSIINLHSSPNAFQMRRSKQHKKTKIITVQQITKDVLESKLFIVKIDIEGFEQDLFKSNTAWVNDTTLLIIELHDWMKDHSLSSANFLSTIANSKRDFLTRGENIFSIAYTSGKVRK